MHDTAAGAVRRDIYKDITDKIIVAIQRGVSMAEMPWHRDVIAGGRPVNAFTEMAYRGVNVVALWAATETGHFASRYWSTYKQWRMLGAHVREGERGSPIVFYKEAAREAYDEETGEVSADFYLVARSSWVFNENQVEGWRAPEVPKRSQVEVLEQVETLVAHSRAEIRHGGDRACYVPTGDFIQMPDRERFATTATRSATEAYYAVLLHEMTHWTSHVSRLARDLGKRFGDQAYAMEELVAELGAAFLCADFRVSNTPRPDHAAYIANWLTVLKDDKRALFTAASKAAAAAEFLLKLRFASPATAASPPDIGSDR